MADRCQSAIAKFENRSARVGVVGLGYAGLPLTCCLAESGFETFAFDVDHWKIHKLRGAHSYISHIPAHRIAPLLENGRLQPALDFCAMRQCDAVIICV